MNYINEPKINETHQPLNQRKIITIKKSLKLKKEKKRIKKIHKKCQKTKNLRKTEEHIIYKNIINNKANDKDLEVFHLLNQYSNINKCKNNLNDKTKDILNENIFENKNENNNRLENDKIFPNFNEIGKIEYYKNNIINNPQNFPIFNNDWTTFVLYPIGNSNCSTEFGDLFLNNIRNYNNYTNDLSNNNYYNNYLNTNNFIDDQFWNFSNYNMIYPYNNINTDWNNNNYMFLNNSSNRYNNTTNNDINVNINKNIYTNNLNNINNNISLRVDRQYNDIQNDNTQNSDIQNENTQNSDIQNDNRQNNDIQNDNTQNSDIQNENTQNNVIQNDNRQNNDIQNDNRQNNDIQNDNRQNNDRQNYNRQEGGYINSFLNNLFQRKNKTIIENIKKIKINKRLKLDDNKRDCLICLEEFKYGQNVYTLPCSHIFHVHCLKKEIKFRQKCPLCRKVL